MHSYLIANRVNTPYTWNEVVIEIKKNILPPILEKVKCSGEKYMEKQVILYEQ